MFRLEKMSRIGEVESALMVECEPILSTGVTEATSPRVMFAQVTARAPVARAKRKSEASADLSGKPSGMQSIILSTSDTIAGCIPSFLRLYSPLFFNALTPSQISFLRF